MSTAKKIAIPILALAAFCLPASMASAASAPAWQLMLIPLPSNLAPGTAGTTSEAPMYRLIATNVGAKATTGPVAFTATFPAGIVPLSEPKGDDSDQNSPDPTCTATGQEVTCTTPGPVYPSRWTGARIPVEVSPSASGTLTAQAQISGGGAQPIATSSPSDVGAPPPPFGFLAGPSGLMAILTNEDGSPSTQAGSHPDQLTVNLSFPTQHTEEGPTRSSGHVRDAITELPRGLIVNPNATPVRCTELEFLSGEGAEPGCPNASQIGIVNVMTELSGPTFPISHLYNMVPPPGAPAEVAFNALEVGIFVHLKGGVRSDGDYGLTASANDVLARTNNPILDVEAQLWGDPSSDSHNEIRGECRLKAQSIHTCPVAPQKTALLTMPSQCSDPISTTVRADSWEEPGAFKERSVQSADLEGNPVGVSGCSQEEFKPTISAKPTTNLTDSPSGLDFDLHQPQNTELEHIAPANLKDATVTLPKGFVVNPSQADGLSACSEAQVGYLGNGHYSAAPDNCPDAAKIGSLEVTTPLLDHPLPGSVFIAKPYENQFGSLLAIYLSVNDPASGTFAKLAGKAIPDPLTGQLTTRFEENPELPLEDVKLHLFSGARASLITPLSCGTHTTSSDLTPWSTPEGLDAHPSDSFDTTASPGGGSCPASDSSAPDDPSFSAGTILPQAGAYTPFVLKLSRNDGSQRLKGIEATLPPGLAARFAGVTTCSDAQIAQAQSREKPNQGALEQQSPSCPASSQLGTVDVAAGAGPTPFHTEGKAYLAGPYKGAPLSMAIITPAVAGPFDLGAVLVRTALYVDPTTAQGKAVSDPLPQIIDGIPLDVRSIEVKLSRNQFTLNPTSCEPMKIEASATSALEASTHLSSPFQVGGCKGLPFEPKLALRLKGGTKRASHPKLIATLSAKEGEANIAKAQVKLPPSAFLDQAHIKTVCTRVQFAANACPPGSIYGRAEVKTQLFDHPLAGNVYLRSSSHKLPDLVIDLRGPDYQPIQIELAGKTDSVKGALRNTFEAIPDAPFQTARVELFGGKRGLVINSRNLCAHTYRAEVKLSGQNGKAYDSNPAVGTDCAKAKRKHKKRGKG